MCHFLPVHHLGIAFLGRVEGQNITQGLSTTLSFRLFLILLYGPPGRQSTPLGRFSFICQHSLWGVVWPRSGGSVCGSKSQKSLCTSFFWTNLSFCIYHLWVLLNILLSLLSLLFYSLTAFHISVIWWFFTGVWCQQFFQVSGTPLSILVDFSKAIVWTVSTRPVISSRPVFVTILWWLYQVQQLQSA